MKILSWNVNGLNARIDRVKRLTQELQPDIMCFQKVRNKNFCDLDDVTGYVGISGIVDNTQPLFGGVATFFHIKPGFDVKHREKHIDGWLGETGNLQVFDLEDYYLANAYVPYSNAADEKWIKIRQHWDKDFHDLLCSLSKEKPLVVCGDLNIVAQDIDAWDGVSVKKTGCFFDWEHHNFNSLLKEADLVDAYRYFHPEEKDFSYFFQNRMEYRLQNQGFRIDYFLASRNLMTCIRKSEILTNVMDTTNSPIILEIE